MPDLTAFFPASDLVNEDMVWFMAECEGRCVGLTRVLYKIPFELYSQYGFSVTVPGIDVEKFVRENKIAEVGRFAVLPEFRRKIIVAATLMRAAAMETILRGFTHFITDVFEADPNSPYGFHSRVLGFQTVATHDQGELKCESRRITMLLDLKEAFDRLQKKRSWVFRYITQGWNDSMVRHLTS